MKKLRTYLYATLLGIALFASVRQTGHQNITAAQQNPVPTCPVDPDGCIAQ